MSNGMYGSPARAPIGRNCKRRVVAKFNIASVVATGTNADGTVAFATDTTSAALPLLVPPCHLGEHHIFLQRDSWMVVTYESLRQEVTCDTCPMRPFESQLANFGGQIRSNCRQETLASNLNGGSNEAV